MSAGRPAGRFDWAVVVGPHVVVGFDVSGGDAGIVWAVFLRHEFAQQMHHDRRFGFWSKWNQASETESARCSP